MEIPVFPSKLEPQMFTDSSTNPETVLKSYNFYSEFLQILPDVYANATNFMAIVRQIAESYQHIYDIMRSLANSPNFSFSNYLATGQSCSGIYLLILARFLNIEILYEQSKDNTNNLVVDEQLLATAILTKIVTINSRGTHKDFEDYYLAIDNYSQFTNALVTEELDGTVRLDTSFTNNLDTRNVTLAQFEKDLSILKAVGVRINDNAVTIVPRIFTFSSNPNSYDGSTIDLEGDITTDFGNFGTITKEGYLLTVVTKLGQALFKK